jgi:type IV secretory pathway VirB10-like protein
MLDDPRDLGPRHTPVAARPPRMPLLKLAVLALGLAGALAGAYYAAKRYGLLTPVPPAGQAASRQNGNGVVSRITYPDRPKPAVDTRDALKDELARLRVQVEQDRQAAARARQAEALERQALLKRLEALSKRPPPQPAAPPTQTPAVKRAPMLFTTHERREDAPQAGTFRLAPGATTLPCQVETAVNSEVGGHFTLKVTRGVWDTATGQHLLVPQGSTVLGHDEAADLVFGHERLPTYALTLALPNGESVDLGKAPVTDQIGQTGLVSDVNHHWLRNYGAVIISGVLRGGQQVLQTEVAQGGGVGQLGAGIGQSANQVGQQKLGKAIDTRPTITVDPGEVCHVLLVKPLRLPPYDPAGDAAVRRAGG